MVAMDGNLYHHLACFPLYSVTLMTQSPMTSALWTECSEHLIIDFTAYSALADFRLFDRIMEKQI
jgi:hypothetical protein